VRFSRQGAIQIYVYLYLYLTFSGLPSQPIYRTYYTAIAITWLLIPSVPNRRNRNGKSTVASLRHATASGRLQFGDISQPQTASSELADRLSPGQICCRPIMAQSSPVSTRRASPPAPHNSFLAIAAGRIICGGHAHCGFCFTGVVRRPRVVRCRNIFTVVKKFYDIVRVSWLRNVNRSAMHGDVERAHTST